MSFLGKVLDLNKNIILLGKWPRSSPAVRRALFAVFGNVFPHKRTNASRVYKSFSFNVWVLGELESSNFGF